MNHKNLTPSATLHHWEGNYLAGQGIALTMEEAQSCTHSGPCDDDVAALRLEPHIIAQLAKVSPEQLKKELAEFGVWNDEELSNHDENLTRLVWIAAGDIVESHTN